VTIGDQNGALERKGNAVPTPIVVPISKPSKKNPKSTKVKKRRPKKVSARNRTGPNWLPAARDPVPDLLVYPWSDAGNAERIITLYGYSVRYSPEMKTWLIWDGRCWRIDRGKRIRLIAILTMRTLGLQVAGLRVETESQRKFKEFVTDFYRMSENSKGVSNMLTQAAVMGDQLEISQMDSNPWLLNCLNVTIDLQTGRVLPHRPGDFITKCCAVVYDPNAKCDRFLSFIHRIMGDREELCAYLQRVFGYALTGLVSEKALFCFFGAGDNGKTTFLELFRWLLGTYSAQVLIESLMSAANQSSNSTSADLADLQGARYVTTSEAEEGQRLAEGKIKYLTGMSEVKSCRKYENPITFKPTHKVFMDANQRPIVRGTDRAIWKRLKPIAFTVTIPDEEKDKHLLEKLKAEGPGILAWAVRGCLEWQWNGLCEPAEIETESARWKADNDPLKDFIEDQCEIGPERSITVANLYREYDAWAIQGGERPLTKKQFSGRLTNLGYTQGRKASDRFWSGILFCRF
jgi:putative DNA primase/helicase